MDNAVFLAKPLSILINAIINRLDSEAWQPLASFENKIVCFQVEGFKPLYFIIKLNGLELTELKDDHCEVSFSGPLSAFINMVFKKNHSAAGLHVRGNIACAKALYDTWQHLDLDWEQASANLLGDNVAHLLHTGLRATSSWLKTTWQDRLQDITHYLQDEQALLPTPLEVENLLNDIDNLRLRVDRFEAKLNLLLQKI